MATIRETILSYPSLDDCETYLDNVVMVKRRINGGDECTPDNIGQAMLCAADLYAMVVNSTDFSEGKLSITHPRSWYIQTAKGLYIEGGEPGKAAKIGKRIIVKGKAGNRW
ncbi:hypothetical protein [Bacteroides neonati]|uniref:hypothetical protein n=1 Tax=Bacteroides neonati TaxID=1347393 RepID=UPI0004B48852|nr:hypothetical protein [Bacteroides neonati]